MASHDDDKTQQTVAKTLWSETLIDLLIVSLQKKQPDDKVIGLLAELKQKKFKNDYIVGKIERAMDATEAARVRVLLGKL